MQKHICLWLLSISLIYSAELFASTCSELPFNNLTNQAESAYNQIFIYTNEPCVKMTFRRVGKEWSESVVNKNDPTELPAEYAQILTVATAYPKDLNKIVMLGVGGGSILSYFGAYLKKSEFIGVELDPKVLEFDKSDFNFYSNKQLKLVESDGRIFMTRSKEKFDLIILDAYRGGYVPSHMLTREFYQVLSRRLTVTGVISINLHAGTALFDSSLKTIQSVFPTVDIFPANGNAIVVATNQVGEMDLIQTQAESRQKEFGFRYSVPGMLSTRVNYFPPIETKTLTDDFAPANQLDQIKVINSQWRTD